MDQLFMFKKIRHKIFLQFRDILYLLYFLSLILPLCAIYLANTTGKYNQYGWWLVAVYVFFTGADQIIRQRIAESIQ